MTAKTTKKQVQKQRKLVLQHVFIFLAGCFAVNTLQLLQHAHILDSSLAFIATFDSPQSRRTRTLIIVPYRNRSEQLEEFIPQLTNFLSRQKSSLDFRIIVVEHSGTAKFNKGALLNVGFIESMYVFQSSLRDRTVNFDCVVCHDIDLIPVHDENGYDCSVTPDVAAWQMSSAIDKYGWQVPNSAGVGGVGMATREAFLLANGWSNRYFGWGGEDNDFFGRLSLVGRRMKMRNLTLGRYRSLQRGHNRSPGKSDNRGELLLLFHTLHKLHEGLPTVKYRLLKREQRQFYHFVSVDLWLTEDPDRVERLKDRPDIKLDWTHLGY